MISMAAKHRLGPWVVGLYLIAQIFGVVPVISGHTAHVVETHSVLVEHGAGGEPTSQSHHKPGDTDGPVQHHAMQDLNGVLASLVDRGETALVHVAIPARAQNDLLEADPVLLERPPKPLLSV